MNYSNYQIVALFSVFAVVGFVLLSFSTIPAMAEEQRYVFVNKWGSKCNTQPDGSCDPPEDGKFSGPRGLSIDQEGFVYVVDSKNNRIQKFTNDGVFVTKWGSFGSGDGQFANPTSVAIDYLGFVYVGDVNNKRIQKFTSDGTFVSKRNVGGHAMGITVDKEGFIYVVSDAPNPIIQKYTNDYEFVTSWETPATRNGQTTQVFGIVADEEGFIYVTESDINYADHPGNIAQVLKFTNDGQFVTTWGTPGTGNGQFYGPVEIDTDQTNVYVTEFHNSRVQKFTNDGQFVTTWGTRGIEDGQFAAPSGLEIDPEGKVFVSDFLNNNIQVFEQREVDPPVANAGSDQSVKSGDIVRLDGRNSSDPNNSPVTYSWIQTEGPEVVLSNPNSSNPTFEAPKTNEEINLVFQLTVTNEEGITSEPDEVIITVKPIPIPPPSEEEPRTIQDIIKGIIQNPLNVTNSVESSKEIRELLTDNNQDNDQIACNLLGGQADNLREILKC